MVPKCLPTCVTFEVVDVGVQGQMLLQVFIIGESLSAELALVGIDPCVDVVVALQVVRWRKSFPAEVTRVLRAVHLQQRIYVTFHYGVI